MKDFAGDRVRALVVWEPVLLTDWSSPSTMTLGRISSTHAEQFWDRHRVASHLMGEHDRGSIVWDYLAVYPPGVVWRDYPPRPLYDGGPVVRVIGDAKSALRRALRQ